MFVCERERDYCTEAYSQKMVAASNHTNVAVIGLSSVYAMLFIKLERLLKHSDVEKRVKHLVQALNKA